MVSVISVFIQGEQAQFRKFATIDAEQGKGFGSKLLQYIFDQLANSDIRIVWCNARTEKAHFYERFGMIQTDRRFVRGGIPYVIMKKSI